MANQDIVASLADGTELHFPAGTDPAVIQNVVKQRMAADNVTIGGKSVNLRTGAGAEQAAASQAQNTIVGNAHTKSLQANLPALSGVGMTAEPSAIAHGGYGIPDLKSNYRTPITNVEADERAKRGLEMAAAGIAPEFAPEIAGSGLAPFLANTGIRAVASGVGAGAGNAAAQATTGKIDPEEAIKKALEFGGFSVAADLGVAGAIKTGQAFKSAIPGAKAAAKNVINDVLLTPRVDPNNPEAGFFTFGGRGNGGPHDLPEGAEPIIVPEENFDDVGGAAPTGHDPLAHSSVRRADQEPEAPEETSTAPAPPTGQAGGNGGGVPPGGNGEEPFDYQEFKSGAKKAAQEAAGNWMSRLGARGLNKSMSATPNDLLVGNPGRGLVNSDISPFESFNYRSIQKAIDEEQLPAAEQKLNEQIAQVSQSPAGTRVIKTEDVIDPILQKARDDVRKSVKSVSDQRKQLEEIDNLETSIRNRGVQPENAQAAQEFRTQSGADLSLEHPDSQPFVNQVANEIEQAGRTPREFTSPRKDLGNNPSGYSSIQEAHDLKEELTTMLGSRAVIDPATTQVKDYADRAALQIRDGLQKELEDSIPGYQKLNQQYSDLKAASRVVDRKVRAMDVGRGPSSQMGSEGVLETPLYGKSMTRDAANWIGRKLRNPFTSLTVGKLGNTMAGNKLPTDLSADVLTIPREAVTPPSEAEIKAKVDNVFRDLGFSDAAIRNNRPDTLAKMVKPERFSGIANKLFRQVKGGEISAGDARKQLVDLHSRWAEVQRFLKPPTKSTASYFYNPKSGKVE